MSGQTRPKQGNFMLIVAIAVLAGIVVTSALVPLKPVMQQALIGFTLVWLGVTAMLGLGG
jgi:hypothetical protein